MKSRLNCVISVTFNCILWYKSTLNEGYLFSLLAPPPCHEETFHLIIWNKLRIVWVNLLSFFLTSWKHPAQIFENVALGEFENNWKFKVDFYLWVLNNYSLKLYLFVSGFYLVSDILPVFDSTNFFAVFFLGKESHPFSASHHQYTLYFKKMCQRNNVYKTERSVTRRPADLVTKENMKEIAQKYVMVQICIFFGWSDAKYSSKIVAKRKLGIKS